MENPQEPQEINEKQPDENTGLYFDEHFRIFDPETQEDIVKARG